MYTSICYSTLINFRNIYFFSVILIGIFFILPFVYNFIGDFGLASVLSEDHEAHLARFFKILYPPENISRKEYWNTFLEFAYGPVFWLIPSLLAIPFKMLNSESGIILVISFVPYIFLSASGWILLLISREKLFLKLPLFYKCIYFSSIFILFTSPLIIGKIKTIGPELIYTFFLLLSFYLLFKDQNCFGKKYYLSIIFYTLGVATKAIAIFAGIIFLIYYLNNKQIISKKIIKKTFLFIFTVILICYFPLWFSGDIIRHVAHVGYQGFITINGWPQDNVSYSFKNSITYFNNVYLNFNCFITIIGSCLFLLSTSSKKNSIRSIYVFLTSSFSIVLIYFIYCILLTFSPGHYGITLLIFTPVLILFMLVTIQNIKNLVSKYLILFFLLFFIVFTIKSTFNTNRLNLSLNEFQIKTLETHYNIKKFLSSEIEFNHPCIDKQISLLKVNDKRIKYSKFSEESFSNDLVKQCDIFIFWKESRIYGFFNSDHKNYSQKINDSIKNFQYVSQSDDFDLIHNKNNILIYKKNEN